MEINNLRELNKYGTLKCGDSVEFHVKDTVIRYYVDKSAHGPYLKNVDGPNQAIFHILKLDKQKFCSQQYEYEANISGNWPNSKNNDFKALTKAVRKLYMITGETEEDKIETDRFSLIDLD